MQIQSNQQATDTVKWHHNHHKRHIKHFHVRLFFKEQTHISTRKYFGNECEWSRSHYKYDAAHFVTGDQIVCQKGKMSNLRSHADFNQKKTPNRQLRIE